MTPEDEWDAIRRRRAPLFGVCGDEHVADRPAVRLGSRGAGADPCADGRQVLEDRRSSASAGLDFIGTGSIGGRGAYTIRRSVLQEPGAVCIIDVGGQRSGDC